MRDEIPEDRIPAVPIGSLEPVAVQTAQKSPEQHQQKEHSQRPGRNGDLLLCSGRFRVFPEGKTQHRRIGRDAGHRCCQPQKKCKEQKNRK